MFAPLILCLDDLQYADTFSFKALSDIIKRFDRLMIIGALRDSCLEKPLFPHAYLPAQERIFSNGVDNIRYQLQKISSPYVNHQNEEFTGRKTSGKATLSLIIA